MIERRTSHATRSTSHAGRLRILCGYSFDRAGEAAVSRALGLARTTKAHVCILHCVPPDRPFSLEKGQLPALRRIRRTADSVGVTLSVRVTHASPAEAIPSLAAEERFNLVVVGRGGSRGGLDTLQELALPRDGAAVRALLVVPERAEGERRPSSLFRRVLWAIGRTPASLDAEDAVLGVLNDLLPELTLLTLTTPGESTPEAARRLSQALSGEIVERIRPRLRLEVGDVAATVLDASRSVEADLIVAGVGNGASQTPRSPIPAILERAAVPVLLTCSATAPARRPASRLRRAA